jgi:hypothetical protein
MEEKLKEILDRYELTILDYEQQKEKLLSKIDWCNQHDLKEEKRIANVELKAISFLIFEFRNMHIEIKDVLNAWLS